MPKFKVGERVLYHGMEGTVVDVTEKVKYTVDISGDPVPVYESDLVSAETTESEWEADGGYAD